MPQAKITILDACMKQENFTPVYLPGADEKEFSYYGNQHLLYINEVVQRAAMSTGKKFSFTVIKDERTEKQYHGQG